MVGAIFIYVCYSLFQIVNAGVSILQTSQTPQYLLPSTFSLWKSCTPVLSIALVIDVTQSQFDKIGFIKQDLNLALQKLLTKYPGSIVSVSTHTDKPVKPLGFNLPTWVDYCLNIRTVFEDSLEVDMQTLNGLYIGGGQDFPENAWDAFARAALAPQLHWRNDGILPDGRPHIKIIMLVADAYAHMPNDLHQAVLYDTSIINKAVENFHLTPADLALDPNAKCSTMEYPALSDVSTIIKNKHYLPIILTAPAHYVENGVKLPYPELKKMAADRMNSLYEDPVEGIKLYYTEALKDLGVTGMVQSVEETPAAFAATFMTAVESLVDLSGYCNGSFPVTTTPKSPPPCTDLCNGSCCGNVDINISVNVV